MKIRRAGEDEDGCNWLSHCVDGLFPVWVNEDMAREFDPIEAHELALRIGKRYGYSCVCGTSDLELTAKRKEIVAKMKAGTIPRNEAIEMLRKLP